MHAAHRLFAHLAKINFKDRATIQGGRVTYRLADGSGHVDLDAAEWRSMNAAFDEQSARCCARRGAGCSCCFPVSSSTAMTLGQVMPGAGLIIVAGIFLGPPGIYLWQSHRIKRIAATIEAELACRNKVAAPRPAPWRVPRGLEIACAVLVGPHLIFEVYGSIHPEAYRNTPLLGTSLNWTSLVSFSIIATIVYFRWRAVQHRAQARFEPRGRAPQRPAAAPEPPATREAPAGRTFGRKADAFARARDSIS